MLIGRKKYGGGECYSKTKKKKEKKRVSEMTRREKAGNESR